MRLSEPPDRWFLGLRGTELGEKNDVACNPHGMPTGGIVVHHVAIATDQRDNCNVTSLTITSVPQFGLFVPLLKLEGKQK